MALSDLSVAAAAVAVAAVAVDFVVPYWQVTLDRRPARAGIRAWRFPFFVYKPKQKNNFVNILRFLSLARLSLKRSESGWNNRRQWGISPFTF